MKCIVIQTSPERINAEPVTNEDGTPHIYATISEARAELKSNGYSYNSANERYYIKGTEYRAYILREDSEEYAEIMEQDVREAAAFKADDAAARFCAALTEATGEVPYFEDAASVCKVARDDIAGEHRSSALDRDAVDLMTEAIADAARAADPEDLEEPAPLYQRHELEAYLGEPDDYDVDAIEAEATRFTADGARVWSASDEELAAIAERHELVTYYAI